MGAKFECPHAQPCDAEEGPFAEVPELEPDLRHAGLLDVGEGDEVAVAKVEGVPGDDSLVKFGMLS